MECKKEMQIGVIGCGFVGATVADFLEEHLVNVWRVDPEYYPNTTVDDIREKCDAFIICVPTPEGKNGTCDDSIVKQVIKELYTRKPILLKSTVTPDLLNQYADNVTYNPEFLRALHAKEDFAKQSVFVLGGDNQEHIEFWQKLFSHLNTNMIQTNRTTASMIKYVHNAWLATKVAFFHELFENAPKEMNYSDLISTLAQIPSIGKTHMIVEDSRKLGFDGHCFPKDTKALTNFMNHTILQQAITTNNELRKRNIK